jgi:hypothetical protein
LKYRIANFALSFLILAAVGWYLLFDHGQSDDHLPFYKNRSGKWQLKGSPAEFDGIGSGRFSGGCAAVSVDNQWGFIDPAGNWVVKPIYQRAYPFSHGYAVVQEASGRYTFINRHSEPFPVTFEDLLPFNEGLAPAKENGKWGYVNTDGQWAINPIYDVTDGFSEGLATVRLGTENLVIDHTGATRIRKECQEISGFIDGMAIAVYPNNRSELIDNRGNALATIFFAKVFGPFNGRLVLRIDGKSNQIPLSQLLTGDLGPYARYVIRHTDQPAADSGNGDD